MSCFQNKRKLTMPEDKQVIQELLEALEEAAHALNRWGPAAGARYLKIVESYKEESK